MQKPITKAIFFGSLGALVETSDIQRRAYNEALKESGLDWSWDTKTYSELLEMSGGKDRLSMLSAATGRRLSDNQINSIHARKTELACAEVIESEIGFRPGVRTLIEAAKSQDIKVGFVTTTYDQNIDAVMESTGMSRDDFDIIIGKEKVQRGKPSPEAYQIALSVLDLPAQFCIAIEDTANSVMSAKRAGIYTIATPGALSLGQDFWQADIVARSLIDNDDRLLPELLERLRK